MAQVLPDNGLAINKGSVTSERRWRQLDSDIDHTTITQPNRADGACFFRFPSRSCQRTFCRSSSWFTEPVTYLYALGAVSAGFPLGRSVSCYCLLGRAALNFLSGHAIQLLDHPSHILYLSVNKSLAQFLDVPIFRTGE